MNEALLYAGGALTIVCGTSQWDFVHCEPGGAHVFIGAGDGPCWILEIGARREGATLDYPASELAARHGAAAPAPTTREDDAHADWPLEMTPVRAPWPPR